VIENYFFSESQPPTNTRHYVTTFLLCMVAMAVSIAVDKLGLILEVWVDSVQSQVILTVPGL
jgi:sodium-coupled neutral amino acid transporter 11